MQIEYCPQVQCRMPAEVAYRFTLWSTHGPLEHVAVRCLDGHQFVMPAETLLRAS